MTGPEAGGRPGPGAGRPAARPGRRQAGRRPRGAVTAAASRRRGVFGAGAIASGLAGYLAWPGGAGRRTAVPFYGPHQAGIATPAQDRLAFGSLNVVAGATRADVRDLLREWTTAAAAWPAGS